MSKFESVEQVLEKLSKETRDLTPIVGVKAGVLINASRTAVTGAIKGASLFEILECLGRERVVRRLRDAADRAE